MDYTLNIVSKCRFFSLYLNIRGLRKGPGKFFMRVLESPGKVLDFFSVKEWEPCHGRLGCWGRVNQKLKMNIFDGWGENDVYPCLQGTLFLLS